MRALMANCCARRRFAKTRPSGSRLGSTSTGNLDLLYRLNSGLALFFGKLPKRLVHNFRNAMRCLALLGEVGLCAHTRIIPRIALLMSRNKLGIGNKLSVKVNGLGLNTCEKQGWGGNLSSFTQLPPELRDLYSMLRGLPRADENNRNVPTLALFQKRIFI